MKLKRPKTKQKMVRCLGPCKEHKFLSSNGGRICSKGERIINALRLSPLCDRPMHDPRNLK